jgi:hypothetical protein
MAQVTRANAAEVLQETTRALTQCGEAAGVAWADHALALMHLDRRREAFEAFQRIPREIRVTVPSDRPSAYTRTRLADPTRHDLPSPRPSGAVGIRSSRLALMRRGYSSSTRLPAIQSN